MYFKYNPLQGWSLNHFPGHTVQMFDNLFGEEIFLTSNRSKSPPAQLAAVSSSLSLVNWDETDSHLLQPPFR